MIGEQQRQRLKIIFAEMSETDRGIIWCEKAAADMEAQRITPGSFQEGTYRIDLRRTFPHQRSEHTMYSLECGLVLARHFLFWVSKEKEEMLAYRDRLFGALEWEMSYGQDVSSNDADQELIRTISRSHRQVLNLNKSEGEQ